VPDDDPLTELADVLRGKVLRCAENGSDAGFYWEKTTSVHLHADESFRYVEHSVSSVSGGGLSMPSESTREAEGTWHVRDVDGVPALVLWDGEDVVAWWHTRDGGTGVQYMDGVPWERYLIDG
jgi:hypothetical protein